MSAYAIAHLRTPTANAEIFEYLSEHLCERTGGSVRCEPIAPRSRAIA
jgi:hypothetical protein